MTTIVDIFLLLVDYFGKWKVLWLRFFVCITIQSPWLRISMEIKATKWLSVVYLDKKNVFLFLRQTTFILLWKLERIFWKIVISVIPSHFYCILVFELIFSRCIFAEWKNIFFSRTTFSNNIMNCSTSIVGSYICDKISRINLIKWIQ